MLTNLGHILQVWHVPMQVLTNLGYILPECRRPGKHSQICAIFCRHAGAKHALTNMCYILPACSGQADTHKCGLYSSGMRGPDRRSQIWDIFCRHAGTRQALTNMGYILPACGGQAVKFQIFIFISVNLRVVDLEQQQTEKKRN